MSWAEDQEARALDARAAELQKLKSEAKSLRAAKRRSNLESSAGKRNSGEGEPGGGESAGQSARPTLGRRARFSAYSADERCVVFDEHALAEERFLLNAVIANKDKISNALQGLLLGDDKHLPIAHQKLTMHIHDRGHFSLGLKTLPAAPPGVPTFSPIPDEVASTRGDYFVDVLHLSASESYAKGASDFRITTAYGCDFGISNHHDRVYRNTTQMLKHIVAQGTKKGIGDHYLKDFPRMSAWASQVFIVPATKIVVQELDNGISRVDLRASIDWEEVEGKFATYKHLASVINPFEVVLCNSDSNAVLVECYLKKEQVKIIMHVKDGEFVSVKGQPLCFDENGTCEIDATIDGTATPSPEVGAIPLPKARFRIRYERNGSVLATCVDAAESAYESLANMVAFDIASFRNMIKQGFKYTASYVYDEVRERFVVKSFLRFLFPTSTCSSVLVRFWKALVPKL